MALETAAESVERELKSSIDALTDIIAQAESRGLALNGGIETARNILAAVELRPAQRYTLLEQRQKSASAKQAAERLKAVLAVADTGQALDEWKECRFTIDRCDKLLVDLRKTGFGFVTTIVGATAFLFAQKQADSPPVGNASIAASTALTLPDAKVAIFCMLVLLIVVLYWIDLAHQTWLGTAVKRAKQLEDYPLGFKLSTRIGEDFAAAQAIGLGLVIYLMLLAATATIFWIAIPDQATAHRTIIGATSVLGIVAMIIGLVLSNRNWRNGSVARIRATPKSKF